MKRLLLLTFVLLASIANATNYYVSTLGNDANTGTSAATAWKTISKVNAFTFAANDSILFNRGNLFYGAIVVSRNNLNFAAYGNGARPIISGFTALPIWIAMGGGVYKVDLVAGKNNLSMVTLNGRPQPIGRYPNYDTGNSGYLTFNSATGTSITDNTLTSAINWTGAEVAIRKNGWTIDRCIVTNHSGSTITYRIGKGINTGNTPLLSNAKIGHGYFIMDDPRTLDQLGEWYFDTTAKSLQMFFGTNLPTSYAIKASTIDTLLNINNKTFISVNNIDFDGANMSAIYALNGNDIKIQNSNMSNMGAKGVHIFACGNVLVENVNTNNVLSNGIQVTSRIKSNVTVRNCVVRNTSQIAGMGSYYDDSDYKGIYVVATNNVMIENNVVDTVGIAGIQFDGSDVTVRNNLVNYYCTRLQDNGGIYTFANGTDAAPGNYYTNRLIKNNIIMNGIGAPDGTTSTAPALAGIYLDGRTMNVNVLDNTIFNIAKNGIHCNNPSSINILNNTFYNNGQDISYMRWAWGSISNLVIKNNISFPLNASQKNLYYTNAALNTPTTKTLQTDLQSLGNIDSNYYNTFTDAGFNFEIYETAGGALLQTSPYSLDGWRDLTAFDHNARRPAQKIQPYTIVSTLSTNLFSNAQFASNINTVTAFGANVSAAWNNSSKITGVGSLRMDFSAPQANRYGLLHSPMGAISNTKKYVLRFKTLGTSTNGIVRAYIRKTNSPYNNLVPVQTKSFGTSKQVQEFLFTDAIADAAGGSFVIEIEQNSGTTYIDDVEFIEVNATINTIESQVRFEYNATNSPVTITLDSKYIAVDSTVYNGSLTLQPFTSKVIIKAGAIDSIPVVLAGNAVVIVQPVDSVILNGIAYGGSIVSYNWSKISGPASFNINSPATAVTKISGLVLGTYVFQLRATNLAGLTATDSIRVFVTSVILPVKLLSFSAFTVTNNVQLQWQATTEINSSHYLIERSIDSRIFETVGTVTSNNNSGSVSNYTITDSKPFTGVVYYRLVMVDKNGSVAYSKIVPVNRNNTRTFSVDNILLNSFESAVKINISSTKQQQMKMVIVDVNGRVIVNKSVGLIQGSNNIVTAMPAVSKSLYYVKVVINDEAVVKSILSE